MGAPGEVIRMEEVARATEAKAWRVRELGRRWGAAAPAPTVPVRQGARDPLLMQAMRVDASSARAAEARLRERERPWRT